MRLLENAAHGDPANHARELQRGGDDGALTDGHRNGFTGIPLAMIDALDPFRGRHQPGQFLGEIDPGLATQAQFTAVVGKAVDAQAHSDVVEKDVARLKNRFTAPRPTVRPLPVSLTLQPPAIPTPL